jgi:hypothetical protein
MMHFGDDTESHDIARENETLRAEVERLRAALSGLVEAVTAEVNEKGGGGYILARLSDARAALEPKP